MLSANFPPAKGSCKIARCSFIGKHITTAHVRRFCNEMFRLFMHAIQNFNDYNRPEGKTHPPPRTNHMCTTTITAIRICKRTKSVHVPMEIVERLSSLFRFSFSFLFSSLLIILIARSSTFSRRPFLLLFFFKLTLRSHATHAHRSHLYATYCI